MASSLVVEDKDMLDVVHQGAHVCPEEHEDDEDNTVGKDTVVVDGQKRDLHHAEEVVAVAAAVDEGRHDLGGLAHVVEKKAEKMLLLLLLLSSLVDVRVDPLFFGRSYYFSLFFTARRPIVKDSKTKIPRRRSFVRLLNTKIVNTMKKKEVEVFGT